MIIGSDAVKAHATDYIPMGKIDKDEYVRMIQRGEFFPATSRTAEGIHGLIFSKPPATSGLDKQEAYTDSIDGKGSSLFKFISDVTWEFMQVGWGGILVDAPNTEGGSQLQAEKLEMLPYCAFYKAEDIINVKTQKVGRMQALSMVVLREFVEKNTQDEYTTEIEEQYRVLIVEDNVYHNKLFNKDGDVVSDITPKKAGKHLNYIPFFFKDIEPQKPMFKDLADVNIGHFRLSVDHRNGLHWTAVPTPYVLGYVPEPKIIKKKDGSTEEKASDPVVLGGSKVMYFPQGTTAFNYLEFSGSGLAQIVTAMDRAEERMAILGARIISAEKKGVESAETARIHRAGENSVVAAFANECSDFFTKVITEYLEWCNNKELAESVSIKLNTDFDLSRMESSEIAALISCWQSGGISKRVLFDNLKEGEVIPDDKTFEEMEIEIAQEVPAV